MWPCRNLRKCSESSFAPWDSADVRSQCDHATETPQKSSAKLYTKSCRKSGCACQCDRALIVGAVRRAQATLKCALHRLSHVRTRVRTRVQALCVRCADSSICTLHHLCVRTCAGVGLRLSPPLFLGARVWRAPPAPPSEHATARTYYHPKVRHRIMCSSLWFCIAVWAWRAVVLNPIEMKGAERGGGRQR